MAGEEFTLYFTPGSYYSCKAFLALEEKGIPFKQSIVNLSANEQLADWYLKINPKGEVPVLQHGTKFIPDSEAIIDYIDAVCPQGPRLVPDVETGLGQDVQTLRRFLHAIPIDHITFGVMANKHLCSNQPRFPKILMTKTMAVKRLRGMLDGMRAVEKKIPEAFREELLLKIKRSEQRLVTIVEEKAVASALNELEEVFDTLEKHLQKSKNDSTGNSDYWLLGNNFTVADITAAMLMYRLSHLGMDGRYFSDIKRPLVKDYNKRLCERPTMKRTLKMADGAMTKMLKMMVWKYVKVGLCVGLIALGVLGAHEVYKGRVSFRKT